MPAKYQIFKDVAEKFRFRLIAENNKIVAVSEAYEQKVSAINGAKSVQANCQSKIEDKTVHGEALFNPKYQIFMDDASKFRFNLSASNGEIIAASEGYESKKGVMNGIDAVQRSCNAEIEDITKTQPTPESPYQTIMAIQVSEKTEKMPLSGATIFKFNPPTTAKKGSTVTFTGKLLTKDSGEAIANAKVDILEADRSFMKDDYMGSGVTAKDGSFSIDWVAKPMDWWDNTVEVYALFKGKDDLKPTCSNKNILTISTKQKSLMHIHDMD